MTGFNLKLEVRRSRLTRSARRVRAKGTIVELASLGSGLASGGRFMQMKTVSCGLFVPIVARCAPDLGQWR
jgi:hypothetical protein